ncbi:hypothetical protein AHAS_Ahas04G0229100 [Arachis hypogaea]
MVISTVSIHIFGDVPSSPLVGILQDHINDWSKTALCLTSIFFLAAIIWFIEHVLKKLLDVAHGFQMLIDPKGTHKIAYGFNIFS